MPFRQCRSSSGPCLQKSLLKVKVTWWLKNYIHTIRRSSPKLNESFAIFEGGRSVVSDKEIRLDISTNSEQKWNIYVSKSKFGFWQPETNQLWKLKMSLLFSGSLNTLRFLYSPGIIYIYVYVISTVLKWTGEGGHSSSVSHSVKVFISILHPDKCRRLNQKAPNAIAYFMINWFSKSSFRLPIFIKIGNICILRANQVFGTDTFGLDFFPEIFLDAALITSPAHAHLSWDMPRMLLS